MNRSKITSLIHDDLNTDSKIEKKQLEALCEATHKLIHLCNKKDLKVSDLKWQPHYSTVFKQIKSQLESILSSDNTKNLENLNKISYLLNLKNNMINLFNNFAKFVQENGSLIGTKDNHQRKLFFMKVVHFQFLFFEIQAFFPNGVYSPMNVKISKLPAKLWWERKFGDNIYIDQDVFVDKFKEDFSFINQAEILSFKNSMNFTSTNMTTTFEYDLFTRLYSPWEKLTEVWRIIYSHPAYLHFSTYGDTKDTLSKYVNEPGTYVFRISCKDLGFWTIGYVKATKEMGQVKVDKSNLIEALVEGNKKNMYLYPNGESSNPDLSNLNEYRKEIVVNNEDLKLYECFEDFKECKICRELEKDLQLESCGHQICQTCYKLLRKFDKKLCPFCNQKILSTTKIVNIKDSSIYVDPSVSKNAVENHYMSMSFPSKELTNDKGKNTDLRFDNGSRITFDSVYTNIVDDGYVCQTELPPNVPPRVNAEINVTPKTESKKSFQGMNKSRTPLSGKSPEYYSDKDSFPVYSEMSLQSSMLNDIYCDVTSPLDIVSSTLPCPKKTFPGHKFNSSTNQTNEIKTLNSTQSKTDTSVSQLTNKCEQHFNLENEDVYCFPMEESTVPDVPLVDPIDNHNVSTDINSTQCFYSDFTLNGDDVYWNPVDDIDEANVKENVEDDLFSMWNASDVERALRVAKYDRELAMDILLEFVARM